MDFQGTNPRSNIDSIAFRLRCLRGHVRFLRTRRHAAQPKVAKVLVSVGLTGSPAETIGGVDVLVLGVGYPRSWPAVQNYVRYKPKSSLGVY